MERRLYGAETTPKTDMSSGPQHPTTLPVPHPLVPPGLSPSSTSSSAPLATPEICINDVAFDEMDADPAPAGDSMTSSADPPDELHADDDQSVDQVKKQWRRSSWCPEEDRKKEEKHEKQRMILAVVGKSQSLSSLEGNDNDSSSSDDEPEQAPAAVSNVTSSTCPTEETATSLLHNTHVHVNNAAYRPPAVPLTNNTKSGLATASVTEGTVGSRPTGNRKWKLLRRNTESEAAFASAASSLTVSPSRCATPQFGRKTGGRVASRDHRTMTPIDDVTATVNRAYSSVISLNSATSSPSPLDLGPDNDIMPECSFEGSSPPHDIGNSLQQLTLADVQFIIARHNAQLAQFLGTEPRYGNPASPAMQKNRLHRLSLIETGSCSSSSGVSVPPGCANDEEDDFNKVEMKQSNAQKVKGRGTSMFSKLGSYRQKKVSPREKQAPELLQATHSFVRASFSISSTCVICGKSVANKQPAVQCQNCLINVHDNCCKEQTIPCVPYHQSSAKINGGELQAKEKSCSLPGGSGVLLKSSLPAKEKRALSVPGRAQQAASNQNTVPSAASKVTGSGRVVNDDRQQREMNKEFGDSCQSVLGADLSNASDSLSVSVESLDESNLELADLDDDDNAEFLPADHEPEAWSVTVDKKTLKRMTAKNIKRQDHIWELIQTEKSHYRTLKIMQKVFTHGFQQELNWTQEMVDRIFPRLDELIDIHSTFLHSLIQAQKYSIDRSIEDVGPILLQQFDNRMGERLKVAYGEFCSRHTEAMQLFKDLLKSDSAFQAFIKKCGRNCLCKRLGIPECILLVTQRMTKYPMLLESIIKTTPESTADWNQLNRCLILVREILSDIDHQVDARDKEHRLIDIYNKLDARSFAVLNGKQFKKSDLLSTNRKLLYDGHIKWMSARGKPFEVLAVVLSDVVFFLAENGQKCTFFSQDNKTGVISLSKLLVREKGDTKDSKGVYLICQSKTEPEMYEFVCRSTEERQAWIQIIRNAIANCPDEVGETSESEEERKLQEAISVRLRQLIELLRQKDLEIFRNSEEKMAIAFEILEIFAKDDLSNMIHQIDSTSIDALRSNPEIIMQAMLREVSKLFALMQPGTGQTAVSVLRSLSSTEKHSGVLTEATTVPLPKRADTFSGFESRDRPKVLLRPSSAVSNAVTDQSESCSPSAGSSQTLADSQSTSTVTVEQLNELSETGGHILGGQSDDVIVQSQLFLSRDQCTCMAKILQYIHQIVCCTSSLITEKEMISAQLSEAQFKLARLHFDAERGSHDRKSPAGYHPDKQLEELRSLQGTIQQQKSDLDRDREQQIALVNNQREELYEMQQAIDRQKLDIKAQKEEIQRQREALQRQVDLFEEQRSHFLKGLVSLQGRCTQQQPHQTVYAGGDHSVRLAAMSRSPIGNTSHHRSASDDVFPAERLSSPPHRTDDSFGQQHDNLTATVGSLLNRSGTVAATAESGRMFAGVSVSRRDTMPPMHLMSATNEARAAVALPQQLPLKLASAPSVSDVSRHSRYSAGNSPSSNSSSGSGGGGGGGGLLGRTSTDLSPTESQTLRSDSNNRINALSPASEPSSSSLTPVRAESMRIERDLQKFSAGRHSSAVASHRGNTIGPTSASRPTPPRLVSTLSSGSILPMKLAERPRPKSASSSTNLVQLDGSTVALQNQHNHTTSGYVGPSPIGSNASPTSPLSSPLRSRLSPECVHAPLRNATKEKQVIYF